MTDEQNKPSEQEVYVSAVCTIPPLTSDGSFLPTRKRSVSRTYIDQLTERFLDHRAKGKELYFLTFTYLNPTQHPLTEQRANWYLSKAHRQLMKYLCGNNHYDREYFRSTEPEIYAFLDRPGSRPKDYRPGYGPGPASGWHHHCILAVDPKHIGKLDALTNPSICGAFAKSIKPFARIRTIDVQKIGATKKDIQVVADYASKWAKRNWTNPFSFQVFGPPVKNLASNTNVKQKQSLNSGAANWPAPTI